MNRADNNSPTTLQGSELLHCGLLSIIICLVYIIHYQQLSETILLIHVID